MTDTLNLNSADCLKTVSDIGVDTSTTFARVRLLTFHGVRWIGRQVLLHCSPLVCRGVLFHPNFSHHYGSLTCAKHATNNTARRFPTQRLMRWWSIMDQFDEMLWEAERCISLLRTGILMTMIFHGAPILTAPRPTKSKSLTACWIFHPTKGCGFGCALGISGVTAMVNWKDFEVGKRVVCVDDDIHRYDRREFLIQDH